MRVLILGGNGFIGSHLIDACLAKGWAVRVVDQTKERYRAPNPSVEYLLGEFESPKLLARALKDVDLVFHCISTTLPKSSNENPIFDVTSNVIQTIRLLNGCVSERISKVVFLSSGGTVYGQPLSLPINEGHPTDPMCSYGISKLTIEKYLSLFKELYGLDYAILRIANPYGPRQNPFGNQGAIAVFLGKAFMGQPIEIWGDGEVVRDYLHIDDLIRGILMAATCDSASRIFNLGSGKGDSLKDILNVIGRVVNKNLVVSFAAKRIFDSPIIVLDIARAKTELGWKPQVPLEEGVRDCWEFVKHLPP